MIDKTKVVKSRPEHEAAYADMLKLISRHTKLTPIEMLAVASNMLGKLMAMQDQRVYTSAMVMEIVTANIETGNQQAIADIQKVKGEA